MVKNAFDSTVLQHLSKSACCRIIRRLCGRKRIALVSEIEGRQEVESECKKKINELKNEIDAITISEAYFNDDEKELYYTGLSNWHLLDILFQYVKLDQKKCKSVPVVGSTLLRLHLGVSGQDLAYRFKVYSTTISRTLICMLLKSCP